MFLFSIRVLFLSQESFCFNNFKNFKKKYTNFEIHFSFVVSLSRTENVTYCHFPKKKNYYCLMYLIKFSFKDFKWI